MFFYGFLVGLSALQYSWYFFEALVKSMAQYLIESCRVKVSLSKHGLLTRGGGGGIVNFIIASVGYSLPGLAASHRTTFVLFIHPKSLPLFCCEVTTSLCVALSSPTTGRSLKVTKQAKHVKKNVMEMVELIQDSKRKYFCQGCRELKRV